MEKKKPLLDQVHHHGDEPHLFRTIVRTNRALMAGFSRTVGMPSSRFGLMRLLAASERELGIMDLARILNINAAAVVRQVKALEEEGLVQRVPDQRDARRSYVALTEEGIRLFQTTHSRVHELENLFAERLDKDEIATTVKVLQTVRGFLDDLYRDGQSDWGMSDRGPE